MSKKLEKIQTLNSWQTSGGMILAKMIRAKLEERGTAYLDAMHEIAMDPLVDPRVRVVALSHLLDRQIGKAPEAITVDHKHEVRAMVANITPDIQSKLTEVIMALRGSK